MQPLAWPEVSRRPGVQQKSAEHSESILVLLENRHNVNGHCTSGREAGNDSLQVTPLNPYQFECDASKYTCNGMEQCPSRLHLEALPELALEMEANNSKVVLALFDHEKSAARSCERRALSSLNPLLRRKRVNVSSMLTTFSASK